MHPLLGDSSGRSDDGGEYYEVLAEMVTPADEHGHERARSATRAMRARGRSIAGREMLQDENQFSGGRASKVLAFAVAPRDPQIRSALRDQLAADHRGGVRTHIVDELPICQMRTRADVVVINGQLAGFEIKSDVDRLSRLTTQVGFYGRIFDRAAVVSGPKHLALLRRKLPSWWALWVAEAEDDGVRLGVDRPGERNGAPSGRARVALLSRDEMATVLVAHGARPEVVRGRRPELEGELRCRLTGAQIADAVREALRQRPRAALL